jgi:polyphosphate kinase
LEHSRIYCFGEGESQQIYISSADMMTRNLDHRVEVGAHIFDPEIKREISEFLDILFKDNCKAREILPDGTYRMFKTAKDEPRFCAHEYLEMHPMQRVPEPKSEPAAAPANKHERQAAKAGAQNKKARGLFKRLGKLFKRKK